MTSNKSFLNDLLNFQDTYSHFASAYKGKNADLYLSQFAHAQISMVQSVYGDQYAEQLRAYALQLPSLVRREQLN